MSEPDLAAVRGRVIRPEDPDFAEKSQAHQLAVRQRPAAVVEATSVEDLRAVLVAARATGLTVATQALGHGASEDLDGSILVRLRAFDQVEVDEEAATAILGAGVTAGTLLEQLAGTGLIPAVGTSPGVSVIPLALGGGHAWLSRVVGLSSQTVRRVELLRPDGEHGWVDDASDPELMRVLRGAAGVVGIVTAIEVDLVRAAALTAGSATYAVEAGPAAWRALRDVDVPESLNVFVSSMRMPDLPFLPEQVRGKSWFALQALSLDGDLSAIDPAVVTGSMASAFGPIDVTEIPAITNDPHDATAALTASAVLGELPDDAIDAMLSWHMSDAGAPVVSLGARLLGGGLDREARGSVASIAGGRWLLSAIIPIPPGGDDGPARAAAEALLEIVRPWTLHGLPPTFLALDQRLDAALAPDALELVRAVRDRLGADIIRPIRL